jgi:uncharacterized protein (TIGR03083 family)
MTLLDLLAAQRRQLAGQLAGLSESEWNAPSLCEGWTVRHVAAHVVMPFRYSVLQVALGVARARGDFHRFNDRVARRDAARLSPADLVSLLSDNARHTYRPPGAGYEGPLTDLVVHSLDICRPLGLAAGIDPAALETVLDNLLTPRGVKAFRLDVDGVRLRAADLDWSHGDGPEIVGTAEDLVLALARRRVPLDLSGEGAGRLLVAAP